MYIDAASATAGFYSIVQKNGFVVVATKHNVEVWFKPWENIIKIFMSSAYKKQVKQNLYF